MGVVREVAVIARTRHEAAAKALEELIRNSEWNPGGDPTITVTVHEPVSAYDVTVDHINKWAREREGSDTIGVAALKSRVQKLLSNP